jgi:hypothetical protein
MSFLVRSSHAGRTTPSETSALIAASASGVSRNWRSSSGARSPGSSTLSSVLGRFVIEPWIAPSAVESMT